MKSVMCNLRATKFQGCTLTQNRRSHKDDRRPQWYSGGQNDLRTQYSNNILNVSSEGASAILKVV